MLQIIQKEFSSCKICKSKYTSENYPMSLSCGETICNDCCSQMLEHKKDCPFSPPHTHNNDTITKNLILTDIINDISCQVKLNKQDYKRFDSGLKEFLAKTKKNSYQDKDFEYTGTLIGNKPMGKGVLIHKDFGIIKGFFDGEFHKGIGRIIYSNNDVYIGKFVNYKKEECGEMRYNNFDRYEGTFKNDLYNGTGKFYNFKEKLTYEGEWKDGKKNGKFNILNDNNEIVKTETYRNDKIVYI